ncbi:putative cryptochrome DASH, mitochondrial [Tolypocladium ophioglossoides CBS 100239]|uniref:Cryptochrome DASH n=1 Tax=Tolypocladium ophioglossoides (strain CBS 100239) TaxID=1163406 RepID=A0A0L0NFB9_TOLOC|nr:putative cryptochrome DASH, mitochondrial [Tolypocladium ophioglossoides CBS 100239]
MAAGKLLVYLLRRDLRASDNPILHHLATTSDHGYTHLLPIYVFPSRQIEISGFLEDGEKSPYPQARSRVGGYWRCGPHRAKFIAQSVWDLKDDLERLDSGLMIRVGDFKDVLTHLIRGFKDNSTNVDTVWMTEDVSSEEVAEQDAVATGCSHNGVGFKLWPDNKYFIDDLDTGLSEPKDLPDVFTTYRKSQEPLRERPRKVLPRPGKSSLPPLPDEASIPPQHRPFSVPDTLDLDGLEARLLQPLDTVLSNPPKFPDGAQSAHPFRGGETRARERLCHLVESGAMTAYLDTRNGLLGQDFSTKLSAYLALGCISARQIHEELLKFEDGKDEAYEGADGYGQGENDGTTAVRFELLWRDYMRLCTAKFGSKLFKLSGFTHAQDDNYCKKWKTANKKKANPNQEPSPEEILKILQRFHDGTTGMGLIDASQRELFLTGYTSNRARQNSASFLSKHLSIDWRYGAEWYEMMLTDYDVSSNWANWQYMAGVGNDPRGDARIFNPVKQAFDYDSEGSYVRTWVPELKGLEKPENVFQAWTTNSINLETCGLTDNIMVTDPVKRIEFTVGRKPRGARRPFSRRRGQGRGGRRGGGASYGQRGPATSAEGSDSSGAQLRPESGARNQSGYKSRPHQPRGGAGPRGNYIAAPVYFDNGNGYAGGGWHGEYNARGRGNYGHFRGGGRWYGPRAGFRGGFRQPTYVPALAYYPPPPNMGPDAPQPAWNSQIR